MGFGDMTASLPGGTMRLGTILRLVRESAGITLKEITKDLCLEKDNKKIPPYYKATSIPAPISAAAWSTYELGTRVPNQATAKDLVNVISPVLGMSLNTGGIDLTSHLEYTNPREIRNAGDFDRLLYYAYYREQCLWGIRRYFPVRYAGAWAIANFLENPNELQCHPYPEPYNVPEDIGPWAEFSNLVLDQVMTQPGLDEKTNFAKWLILGNKFVQKRYSGEENIELAESFFRIVRSKEYKTYTNTLYFCADFRTEGLFFEQIGPSLDALLMLADTIRLSSDMEQMEVTVIGRDEIKRSLILNALWPHNIERELRPEGYNKFLPNIHRDDEN